MLYREGAHILQLATEKRGTVKNLVFTSSFKNKPQLMALVCETIKYDGILQKIIDVTHLSSLEKMLKDENLCKVLLYDFLFGKGLHGAGKLQEVICRHSEVLQAELTRLKSEKNITSDRDLQQTTEAVDNIPRYVRVNTLKTTVAEVVEHFCHEGYSVVDTEGCSFKKYLQVIKSLLASEFAVDIHIDELLVFAPGTDFHEHELYLNGNIILQDKASCLPAVVLSPPAGSCVIDCCAAPGNKTTHLAALLKNTGTVFAFDKDPGRIQTMKSLLAKAGTQCVQTLTSDFLRVNPCHPKYSNVKYILVDPSCSGSGITGRLSNDDVCTGDVTKLQARLKSLSSFQAMILRHAMSFPAVHRVVYSTCSVHEQENEQVVNDVLCRTAGRFRLISALPQFPCRGNKAAFDGAELCLRLDPESSLTNGFFVACFERAEVISGESKKPKNQMVLNSMHASRHTDSNSDCKHSGGGRKKRRNKSSKNRMLAATTECEKDVVTKCTEFVRINHKTKKSKRHRKVGLKKPVTA